ncbi:MAG: ethanolamine utilization protein EutJ [Thermacetogeniaceae bacterium]
MSLESCNELLQRFERAMKEPVKPAPGAHLFTGVDLGTAYIVLAVVDDKGNPVAGAMRFAQVVRDGIVVEFMKAIEIVKEMKKELEERLGVELCAAATAYPPGTGNADSRAIRYVAESAGFDVLGMIDEPTAANNVLKITDGAVVDIGGGTTGIAVFQNGEVIYTADEPTGGTQFSLVIAGALKIPFEEAEELKKDKAQEDRLQPLIKPVMEKVAGIVRRHVNGYQIEALYLVGGTSCSKYIGDVIAKETGIKVIKPSNPLLVTPLGIALHAVSCAVEEGLL